ncbi:MAG: hypothetical protein JW751_29865 [Polyangiaceae bacterium]|nr:hypothetical protein [Polyangiaceae bacterium]
MTGLGLPPFLNGEAQAVFGANGFTREEALHADRAEKLAELLDRAGLPAFQQLFSMEADVGGLCGRLGGTSAEGRHSATSTPRAEDWDLLVGPVAMLETRARRDLRTPAGRVLVPIARSVPLVALAGFVGRHATDGPGRRSPLDQELFATDSVGQVWRGSDPPGLFADSYRTFLAKLALFLEMGRAPGALLHVRPGSAGIAARVAGARRIDEASDRVHEFWRGGGAIIEDAPGETRMWATNVHALATVVTALADMAGFCAELSLSGVEEEVSEPSAAPRVPSLLGDPPRLPLGEGDGAREGWIVVDDSARVHRFRTHGSRLLEWDTVECAPADGHATPTALRLARRSYLLATEPLEGHVSARCLAWIRAHRITRDPAATLPRQDLERELRARGLPAYPPALEFEAVAGGLWVPGKHGRHPLGVSLALREQESSAEGLVPFGSISGPGGYFMDARGHLVVDDFVQDLTFVAASWRILLERLALGHDYLEVAAPEGRWLLWISEDVGEAVAAELDANLVPELSDEYETYWETARTRVWLRPRFMAPRGDCIVSTDRMRALVRALRAARSASPTVRFGLGGRTGGRPPTQRAAEPTARYPFGSYSERTQCGEILVWGDDWVEQHVGGRPVEVFIDDDDEAPLEP